MVVWVCLCDSEERWTVIAKGSQEEMIRRCRFMPLSLVERSVVPDLGANTATQAVRESVD